MYDIVWRRLSWDNAIKAFFWTVFYSNIKDRFKAFFDIQNIWTMYNGL